MRKQSMQGRHMIQRLHCNAYSQELIAAVEAGAEAGGGRLRRLDRKAECREVSEHCRALEAALAGEGSPPAALSLAVPLLAAKVRGSAALEQIQSSCLKIACCCNSNGCEMLQQYRPPV